MKAPHRHNRWALAALVDRSYGTASEFAVEAEARHGTVFDALSGRRQPSADLLDRMAQALDVDLRAISSDPHGVVAALVDLATAVEKADGLPRPVTDALAGVRRAYDKAGL